MRNKYFKLAVMLLIISLFASISYAKKYKFKEDNYSIKLDKSWAINDKYNSSNSLAQLFFSEELKQSLIIRKLPILLLENSKLPSNKKEFVTFLKNNYLKTQMEKRAKEYQDFNDSLKKAIFTIEKSIVTKQ